MALYPTLDATARADGSTDPTVNAPLSHRVLQTAFLSGGRVVPEAPLQVLALNQILARSGAGVLGSLARKGQRIERIAGLAEPSLLLPLAKNLAAGLAANALEVMLRPQESLPPMRGTGAAPLGQPGLSLAPAEANGLVRLTA